MNGNKGFITVNALMIMMITLVSALFLAYTYEQEYLIINSSKNSIQSNYIAESKIYLVLKKEEYYEQQLLPRIKRYLRYEKLETENDYEIFINPMDIYMDDINKPINISFGEVEGRKTVELKTNCTYAGIEKGIQAKLTTINELFELRMPVLSQQNVPKEKEQKLFDYVSLLKDNIEIPGLHEKMTGVDATNYEDVRIEKGSDSKINIKFHRYQIDDPVKIINLPKNEVFIVLKNKHAVPSLSVLSKKESDILKLKGIIYIDGDLILKSSLDFSGIIVLINGNMIAEPACKLKLKGILLTYNSNVDSTGYDIIESSYDLREIKSYGIYLPGFVEPNILVIKSF